MKNGKLSAVVAMAMAANLALAGLATASDSGTGSATVAAGSETFEIDAGAYTYQEETSNCTGGNITLDGTDQTACFVMEVSWDDYEGESYVEDINVTMAELQDGSSNAWNYSDSGNAGVAGNSGLNVPDDGNDGMFTFQPSGSIQSNTDLVNLTGANSGVTGTDKVYGDFAADTEEADVVVFHRDGQVATHSVDMTFGFTLDAPSSVLPGTYSHVITISKTEN